MRTISLITGIFFILQWPSLYSQNPDFTYTPVCFGETALLTASFPLPDSVVTGYYWDFTNNGQYVDAFGKTVSYLFNRADTFFVSLRVNTVDSVYYTDQPKEVIVFPVPQVNFHVDNLCEGQAAVYRDQSAISSGSVVEWRWDFDNNGQDDDISSGSEARYICGQPKEYITRLTVISDKGCEAFATKTTEVYPMPQPDYEVLNTMLNDTTVFRNKTEIEGEDVDIFIWDFKDDKKTMTEGDAFHIYADTGSFVSSLVAISSAHCRDTLVKELRISPSSQSGPDQENGILLRSKIMTPNGDGVNEELFIENREDFEQCQLYIYNIYGNQIYYSSDYQNNWYGRKQDAGTYFYIIKTENLTKKGSINLLR
mgnify:CR=1 FL=1